MINQTNYYDVLGTEEDTSQTIDTLEAFQSTNISLRPNVCITKKYVTEQSNSFNENSTYASIAKQGEEMLVIEDNHIRRI